MICIALWQWFQLKYPTHSRRYLRFEVGGQRKKISQQILKAEGNKAGTSDVFIAIPSREFGGMWLEVKTEKGKLSPNQIDFHEEMKLDYYCATGYGLDDCIKLIEGYMGTCELLKYRFRAQNQNPFET